MTNILVSKRKCNYMCGILLCDYRNSTQHVQAATRNTTKKSDNIRVTRQQLYHTEEQSK